MKLFQLDTLRSKLFMLISSIVLLTIITIIYFVNIEIDKTMLEAQEENAKNVLTSVLVNVEHEYRSIKFYEKRITELKKDELKNLTNAASSVLQLNYQKYRSGSLTQQQAKNLSIDQIKNLRYDNGVGYYWINDNLRPIPRMVMHPTLPELNGKILNDKIFNCALGKNENLFKAFVDVCETDGEGYVDYLWPKPTSDGLTEIQPKLSFVQKFKPWNWILGTGIYIDDLENEVNKMKTSVIEDIKSGLANMKLGEDGYLFIFNSDLKILMHPDYVNRSGDSLINPVTGGKILNEIINSAQNGKLIYDYKWKIPSDTSEFQYKKRAYIKYFEPLDWYIVASVYIKEIEKPANHLQNKIYLISAFFLLFAFIASLILSNNITSPVKNLVSSAKQMGKGKDFEFSISHKASLEVRELHAVLMNLFASIKSATDALRKSEDRLNKTLMAIKDGIWDVNLKTKETYFDPMYYKIAGYEPYEFPVDTIEWRKRIHPEDYNRVDQIIQDHLDNKTEDYIAEYRFKAKNGNWIWILGRGKVMERDASGKALRFVGSHTNITYRKTIEEKLKKSYVLNLKFQEVINNISIELSLHTINFTECCKVITEIGAKELGVDRCAIWLLDEDRKHLNCIDLYEQEENIHHKNISLVTKDYPNYLAELSSMQAIAVSDTKNDDRLKEFYANYFEPLKITSTLDAAIILEGELMGVTRFETVNKTKEWLPDEITFATRIADQTSLAYINSQRLETNQKLKQSQKELLEANDELQSILYVASHDLRSPLVNITGFSSEIELLLKDMEEITCEGVTDLSKNTKYLELKEELEEATKLIHLNTHKMDILLKGLLRLSRLGKAALTPNLLDMNQIVSKIIRGMHYQIDKSGAEIIIDKLPSCYSDETLIGQILSNLIDNAVKYLNPDRKGKITISGSEFENYIIYCVEDNGIGIREEYQYKIFEIFHRLNPDSSIEGIGIGLTIIQKMLKKLEGSIWVESEPDKGSKFFVKIPKNDDLMIS